MKFVRNPSHKHSLKLIEEFNRHKDSISFKDHTQYDEDLLKTTIVTILECKKIGLSSKHILWLTKQIYDNKLTEKQIEEDFLPLVKFHYYNQELLAPIESYKNISTLGIDIESLSEESETVSENELDIFFEKDGWILAMPHTTKASCLLGKGTTWCTSRTKSQNLFLSYVGDPSVKKILFYVIKINGNPSKNPNDKLSVGFINGKPIFNGNFGGITVNSSNSGITIYDFASILGSELAKEMLRKMDEKSQSIKGEHPASKEMERIAKSVDKYIKKINDLKYESAINNFKAMIASYYKLSKEVESLLIEDKEIQPYLASNENLSESSQLILANTQNTHTKQNLSCRATLESAQIILADDEDDDVRANLASNPNIFESVQLILSNDKDEFVRKYLASNPNISKHIQGKLVKDKKAIVKLYLAGNDNLAESIQMKLAGSKNEDIRKALYGNPNLSESARAKLDRTEIRPEIIYTADAAYTKML